MGHFQTLRDDRAMSALTLKADIKWALCDVRQVPITDKATTIMRRKNIRSYWGALKMISKLSLPILLSLFTALSATGTAHAATVVALGASNTFGKGVSRSQSYPAQLETLLRARGLNVHVINAGVNGDTTGGMLARLDRVVPKGTSVVILQPGGNDRRKLAADSTPAIQSQLSGMGIKVVILPNSMLHGLPHQPDGQHLTPEGYHMLAEELVDQVTAALGK
jgi:acyl-CoA thioesterase I